MKSRRRSSDPSSKGKSIVEASDDEDLILLSSDADHSDPSFEAMIVGHDSSEDVSHSEDDEPKKRKNSSRRVRRKVQEREEEQDDEGEEEDEETAIKVEEYVAKVEKRTKRKGKKKKPTLLWEIWEEETEKWLDQHTTADIDLDNLGEVVAETADPPPDLIMPLLRYQKEWLAWALNQEESASRGGILADEMGMGKTVQAIALVLSKRALLREIGEPVGLSSSSSTGLPCVKSTLVICPLIAVMQWASEIDRFTAKGSNKVLIYHGANRAKTLCEFSEYDFVITTYSIVEAEYRKNVMPPKDRCKWCGKLFYQKKLKIHLRYFCGPDAIKTGKQSKQQKKREKLGVNLSLSMEVTSDEREDERKASNYKNTKRGRKKEQLETDSPSPSAHRRSGKSILHSIKWDRIILDEAHYIKDRRCNTTRAVLALESSYKWALSGTPLQNRVGELYSLVRFLQITPYSYYFCKDCDCKVLDYSADSSCPECPHKSVRHFCWWNRNIANPIANRGYTDDGKRAMILLKEKVLKSILLRRTKKGRAADLSLPPRMITLRRDYLDIKEEDYYTSVYNESQAQFTTYVNAGTVMNNYAHIFDLLTRLRQAVNHPYLVVYSKSVIEKRETENMARVVDAKICGLCHDAAEDHVVTSCAHIFCKSCLIDFSASMGQIKCPSCSIPLTVDFSSTKDQEDQNPKMSVKGYKSTSIINRIHLENFQTSTKIDALKEEIRFMVERDGCAKGIVFSQFTAFLDLIRYSLQKSGVKCVQLDGSMSMSAREAAVTRFTEDAECRIFLMSLKAGGVALNLTVASHVFLMDPWWNPAVEQQAQDRIHRIGQYKPIRVVRFVIEDTVEERILKLQEKKQLVFEGTVGGSNEALGRLTEADMRFLFAT